MRARSDTRSWGWMAGWVAVGVVAVAGLLGAFTIGVVLLPVAAVGAVGLAGLAARRTAASVPPAPAPATATGAATGAEVAGSPAGADAPVAEPLATISIVTGIASMVISPPLAIVGLTTGIVARRRIRRSSVDASGAGLALAGIVTSVLGLVIAIVLVTSVLSR